MRVSASHVSTPQSGSLLISRRPVSVVVALAIESHMPRRQEISSRTDPRRSHPWRLVDDSDLPDALLGFITVSDFQQVLDIRHVQRGTREDLHLLVTVLRQDAVKLGDTCLL